MPDRSPKPWRASGAWDVAAPEAGRFGAPVGPAGVSFQPLDHVDLATVIVRDDREDRFRTIMSERFAVAPPGAGRAAFGDKVAGVRVTCVWAAPGQWLVAAPASGDFASLRGALHEIATLTNQGDGRALVRIGGPAARRALAKSIAIDLHADVFGAGSAATTAMAHVAVQLWVEDDSRTFMLAAPRTMAGYVWRCLTAAAAEFGYTVAR